MNNASKNRPLIFIIALLLISNIIMLAFILYSDNDREEKREHSGRFSDFLKKDIGFSEQQLNSYQQLRESHRSIIKPMFENLRETKNQFYIRVNDSSFTGSKIDSAAAKIGEGQANIDIKTFYYFRNIRNLCTAKQKYAFDSAYPQIIRKMIGGQKQEKKDSSSPAKRK